MKHILILQKIFDNLNIKYDMNDLNKGLFNKYDITIKVNGKNILINSGMRFLGKENRKIDKGNIKAQVNRRI